MTAPLDPTLQPPSKTGALALSTYQLTKRFGTFTALDNVSIDVRPGTVHALLGENGEGRAGTQLRSCPPSWASPMPPPLLRSVVHPLRLPLTPRWWRKGNGERLSPRSIPWPSRSEGAARASRCHVVRVADIAK